MIEFYAKSDGTTIKKHTKELLSKLNDLKVFLDKNNFKDILSKEDIKILKYAIFAHDLGKINYKFQKRMCQIINKENVDRLFNDLKNIDKVKDIDIRHEILSVVWALLLYKNDKELQEEDLSLVLSLILLHHYNQYYIRFQEDLYFMDIVNDYGDEIKNYYEFILKNQSYFDNYLSDLKKDFNIKVKINKIDFEEVLETRISCNNSKRLIKLLGILRRCDYSGSGHFDIEKPLKASYTEIYNDFKIEENWWQNKIINEIDLNKDVLLIAPTGSGKTEFSLLFLKKLNRKLMYSLPLRVALNDLYRVRFPEYFGKDYVNVLHSTNYIEYLNEQYQNLDEVYKMLEESKMLSYPLNLTTPDQTLLVSLKYYGYDKIACLFPYSFIVVDEIQMYNEEMLAILISSLKMIKDFGGRILVMSATVPKFVKEKLKEHGIIDEIIDVSDKKYKEYNVKNLDTERHKIKLINMSIFNTNNTKGKKKNNKKTIVINKESLKEIIEIIKENENSNVLIILNNVNKAIKLYEKIVDDKNIKVKKENIYLLHSRLFEKEKSKRIQEIKKKIKNEEKETKNKENIILVATQLVEASVDVDFDILITEISTIDSQIQRWGRIWRNRGNYTKNEPNIYIFTGIDNGTTKIYSKEVVEKTKEILKKYEGDILDYIKEKEMVDGVFSDSKIKEKYENKIKENLEYLKYFTAEKKSEAQKIFRRLASVSIVFKSELDENIKEHITFENRNISWNDLKNLTKLDRLQIKKNFVENSISIPVYLFEKIYNKLNVFEFKGFYVVDNLDKDILDKIRNYGLDSVLDDLNIKIGDEEDLL